MTLRTGGSLLAGFRSVARNWGLVVLVLLAHLALALVLAIPLSMPLEGDLASGGARGGMYGLDHDWWTEGSERLLLPGARPGGVFARALLDPTVLGVGAVYLLLHVFLTGGFLGVFRSPRGGWTARGLVHGSGFYFGRMLRVSILALAAAGIVFALNAPFAHRADELAREAGSGRTALVLALGRHALLLLALVFVHMVSSHAKVLVVREERLSAVLAVLSSLGFCARNLFAALGQYVVVGAAAAVLLVLFGALDVRLAAVGWRSQLVALALFQAFVAARVALRLGLLASQLELQASRGR